MQVYMNKLRKISIALNSAKFQIVSKIVAIVLSDKANCREYKFSSAVKICNCARSQFIPK